MNAKQRRVAYNELKTLLEKTGGRRCYNGKKLVGSNLNKIRSCQKLWILLIASLRLNANYKMRFEGFSKLITSVKSLDVVVFLSSLDEYDSRLMRSCVDPKLRTLESFKIPTDDAALHEFQECLIALIKPFLQDWFSRKTEAGFAAAHQAFAFCKKVSLQLPELREVAFNGWWKTECETDAPTSMANLEARIITRWFPKTCETEFYQEFRPHHGSGQVSEHVDSYWEKWEGLELDARQLGFLRRTGNEHLIRRFGIRQSNESNFMKCCSVTFVNKSWKTYRTISMEPISNMWLQQGCGSAMNYWLKHRKTEFAKFYSIDSEVVNRRLAWAGSMDGCYSTIDLSAASDSVSWTLVKNWFAKSFLAYGLYATRTKYCSVSDPETKVVSVYNQRKFAPMGSRMCFPIETIVFAAISEAVCESIGIYDYSADYPRFVVYGDDIVIRTEAADALIKRLSQFGFEVNTTKSFCNNHPNDWGIFRESCGAEYLNGYDVKPIRLPRTFPGLPDKKIIEKNPSLLASLVVLANDCKSLPFCSMFLREQIVSTWKVPVQWDPLGRTGLYSEHPNYTGYDRRWNSDLQRYEVQVQVLSEKKNYLDFLQDVEHSHLARVVQGATSLSQLPVEYPPTVSQQMIIDYWQFEYLNWYLGWVYDSARFYEWLRINEHRSTLDDDCSDDKRWREPYEVLTMNLTWIPDPRQPQLDAQAMMQLTSTCKLGVSPTTSHLE